MLGERNPWLVKYIYIDEKFLKLCYDNKSNNGLKNTRKLCGFKWIIQRKIDTYDTIRNKLDISVGLRFFILGVDNNLLTQKV